MRTFTSVDHAIILRAGGGVRWSGTWKIVVRSAENPMLAKSWDNAGVGELMAGSGKESEQTHQESWSVGKRVTRL